MKTFFYRELRCKFKMFVNIISTHTQTRTCSFSEFYNFLLYSFDIWFFLHAFVHFKLIYILQHLSQFFHLRLLNLKCVHFSSEGQMFVTTSSKEEQIIHFFTHKSTSGHSKKSGILWTIHRLFNVLFSIRLRKRPYLFFVYTQ